MDNEIFRSTYRDINERFCPYEKSILTNRCGCSQARKFCIAEREGVQCGSERAQQTCLELLELLRRHARFALKALDQGSALPHSKAIRIQVGGLRGIQAALAPGEPLPETVSDIRATVEAALARYGDLTGLPFQDIMKEIAAYRGRERLRRPR